jgi:hypothetical protein
MISILLIISVLINCYLALKVTKFLGKYREDQEWCAPDQVGYKNSEKVFERWKNS